MEIKRSPNYPFIGLAEALSLARQLWEKERRSSMPNDVAAKAWGYKADNGLVRGKLAALKKYGLLEGRGTSGVRLTDLAVNLILQPIESPEYRQALLEAAQKPDLFREILETHGQASDSNLQAHLITKKGFGVSGAKQFIEAFRETQALVQTELGGYTSGEIADGQPPMSATIALPPNYAAAAPTVAAPGNLNISVGPLRIVISVTEGKVRTAHLKLVRQYLDVAEAQLALENETANAVEET